MNGCGFILFVIIVGAVFFIFILPILILLLTALFGAV